MADSSVVVNDLRGNATEVSLNEIRRAYFESYGPLGENHQIVNGDGSVSIVNPVFKYAGKSIPFWAASDSVIGVCKYFGFSSDHGFEEATLSHPLIMAKMNEDGTLKRIMHERHSDHDVMRVVVCSKRQ